MNHNGQSKKPRTKLSCRTDENGQIIECMIPSIESLVDNPNGLDPLERKAIQKKYLRMVFDAWITPENRASNSKKRTHTLRKKKDPFAYVDGEIEERVVKDRINTHFGVVLESELGVING